MVMDTAAGMVWVMAGMEDMEGIMVMVGLIMVMMERTQYLTEDAKEPALCRQVITPVQVLQVLPEETLIFHLVQTVPFQGELPKQRLQYLQLLQTKEEQLRLFVQPMQQDRRIKPGAAVLPLVLLQLIPDRNTAILHVHIPLAIIIHECPQGHHIITAGPRRLQT